MPKSQSMKFLLASILCLLFCIACQASPISQASRNLTICIDPGHPSEVAEGTTGRHITEIQANWKIAVLVKADLEADGIKVVVTKSSEQQFVTNKERAMIANRAHADIMVRLHCDGGNGIGSGFAVYAPDRHGRIDGVTGPSQEVISKSQADGAIFYKTVGNDLRGILSARGFHSDIATHVGAQHGALIGSIYSKVPVVLIEMCVLTNPHDEAFILSDSGSKKLAQAIADGAEKACQPGSR